MTFGKALNFMFLTFISLLLVSIILYHFVKPENGNHHYRDEYGDLIRWAHPFQDSFIDDGFETTKVSTPLFGTDSQGRDLAYRLSKALFTNVWLSILGAGIIFIVLGTTLGILIGYNQPSDIAPVSGRKRLRLLLSKEVFNVYGFFQGFAGLVVKAFHSIPLLLLIIIVVVVVEKTITNNLIRMLIVLMGVGLFSTPKLALLIKDRIQLLEDEEFILAAKASGLSDWEIVWTHIVRYECISIIISQGVYVIIQAIMFETVITFLGYGVRGYSYESIGKLIFEFQNTFPGAIGGEPFALLPVFVLLLIAIVGSGWEKIALVLRFE